MPSLLPLFPANGCLLKDTFKTTASAGTLTGKTRGCEEGPGGLKFLDPNSKISITASGLILASPVASSEYRAVDLSSRARTAGMALMWTSTVLGTFILVNWSNSATATVSTDVYGAQVNAGTSVFFREPNNGTSGGINTLVSGSSHTYAIVLRSTGAFFILDGNLIYVSDADSTATLWPAITALLSSAPSGTIPKFEVAQLTGTWASDYGMATNRTATTANNTTSTSTADGFIQHTITAATGVTQELRVRWTDDSNCWIIRCDQTNSLVKLIEKNGGVETSRGSVAQTWTNGTSYRVACRMIGTEMRVFVQTTSGTSNTMDKITFTIANSFNLTVTGVKVSNAGTNLVCWPYAVSLPTL